MAKRQTEAELGIEITPEEVAEQSIVAPEQPAAPIEDEVIPRTDEEIAEFTDRELAEGKDKVARERDQQTGKFVPKTPAEMAKEEQNKTQALRESREENKRLMERMTTLLEIQQAKELKAAQPAKPEPPAIPDWNVDPIAAGQWTQQQVLAIQKQGDATAQQRDAQQREENEMAQVLNVARPQFEAAKQADPTTAPIYGALLDSFGRELMFVNKNNPEFQRDQRAFMQREMTKLENAHIRHAVATGQNVAEYMRELAASRGLAMGQQPAAQAAPVQQRSIPERQQAQQRHMSLGDAPGGEAPQQVDAKTLAKMSNKEFAAFAKKMSESDLDALMGGRG